MGYNKRRKNSRKPKKIVLIVCEGKTEENYFNRFKTRYNGVKIDIFNNNQTGPINLVECAEKQILYKSIDLKKGGDCAWCVFDVDNNTDEVLKAAHDHAKKSNIQIALSNPRIELWFLLHYIEVHSPISTEKLRHKLEKYYPDYKKGKDLDNNLNEKMRDDAIQRAKKLNETHTKNKINLITTKSNPSTQVFKLIEHITSIK